MLKGFTRNIEPLELLTEEQVETIHRGILDVLEKTGMRIEHERTLKLLANNGCDVDFEKKRVRFPGGLVEECLRKAPSSFRVKARDPKKDLRIGGNTLYYQSGCGLRHVDPDTWEPRPATRKEADDAVKVLDALDSMHIQTDNGPYMEIEGVPPVMVLPEDFASHIRNSTKATMACYSMDSEIFEIKMAKAVGINFLGAVAPAPPLTIYKDACEALFRYAEAGFPMFIGSGPTMGGTGPVTTVGSVISNSAEIMGVVVIAQIVKPGIGVMAMGGAWPMDMRRGHNAFGALECSIHQVMFNHVWRSYKIPIMTCTPGYSSAKKIDFQDGYERALGALVSALSGANLMTFHGAVHGELTFSPIQAVLDDDIATWVGRFIEGVEVNEESLAIDLIEEVGPIPGHYLSSEHTRRLWMKEHFIPKVADRESYPEWIRQGKKGALELARERVEEMLTTHEVTPLTDDQEDAINSILKEAREYYKERDLL